MPMLNCAHPCSNVRDISRRKAQRSNTSLNAIIELILLVPSSVPRSAPVNEPQVCPDADDIVRV